MKSYLFHNCFLYYSISKIEKEKINVTFWSDLFLE